MHQLRQLSLARGFNNQSEGLAFQILTPGPRKPAFAKSIRCIVSRPSSKNNLTTSNHIHRPSNHIFRNHFHISGTCYLTSNNPYHLLRISLHDNRARAQQKIEIKRCPLCQSCWYIIWSHETPVTPLASPGPCIWLVSLTCIGDLAYYNNRRMHVLNYWFWALEHFQIEICLHIYKSCNLFNYVIRTGKCLIMNMHWPTALIERLFYTWPACAHHILIHLDPPAVLSTLMREMGWPQKSLTREIRWPRELLTWNLKNERARNPRPTPPGQPLGLYKVNDWF